MVGNGPKGWIVVAAALTCLHPGSGEAAGVARPDAIRPDFDPTRPVGFTAQVVPILTKLGCNSGSCHGKAAGQHGFALSLFGADPPADQAALISRIDRNDPAASRLITKPTAQVPHGGGDRLVIDSPEYQTLVRWIDQVRSPELPGPEPRLIRLDPIPPGQELATGGRGRVRVVATWDDGTMVDVTRLSRIESNAPAIAEVTAEGEVLAGQSVGGASLLVRYAGEVGVARVTVPSGRRSARPAAASNRSMIDTHIARGLAALGLSPSARCTDAEFARRSTLDIVGLLPLPEAVVAFETDDRPDKRALWVDALLTRPEYADFFASKWATILRNRRSLGDRSKPGTFAFHGWLRQALAANLPYDQIVAAIVAGQGDALSHPNVEWYRQVATTDQRAEDVAQVFLGARIGCARCHHHPTESWAPTDYAGFAAFFAQVDFKQGRDPNRFQVFNRPLDPSSTPILPQFLDGTTARSAEPGEDPRGVLLAWMTQPDHPALARAVVNRYWKHFLGVGIVEPEDDLRATNPPSHPELLEALAAEFVRHRFDLKWLIRAIATSEVYARSSLPDPGNPIENGNYARQLPRRLPAEVLLDAMDQVAGTSERFGGVPGGFRATQLPDDGFVSPFLDAFGRPARRTACECERSSEPNLTQALWLVNSRAMETKLADPAGRAARYAGTADARADATKVSELYRVALARAPTAVELEESVGYLHRQRQLGQTKAGFEDLIWAILNTKEFLFNH